MDEKRIAFIPVNQQNDLKKAILAQITVSPEINNDFAILVQKNNSSLGPTEAINLGQMLKSKIKTGIINNTRINLFTNKYLRSNQNLKT